MEDGPLEVRSILSLCKNDHRFPLRNVTYSYQRVTSQMIQATALTFFDSWCMFILQHLESLLQLFPFCCGVFPAWKTTQTFCVLTHGYTKHEDGYNNCQGRTCFFWLLLCVHSWVFFGHMKHCNRTYNIGSMVRICRRIRTRMAQSLNTFCKWVKEPFHDDHSSYSVYTCIYIVWYSLVYYIQGILRTYWIDAWRAWFRNVWRMRATNLVPRIKMVGFSAKRTPSGLFCDHHPPTCFFLNIRDDSLYIKLLFWNGLL